MSQFIDGIKSHEFMMNGLVALGWASVIGTLIVVIVLSSANSMMKRTK